MERFKMSLIHTSKKIIAVGLLLTSLTFVIMFEYIDRVHVIRLHVYMPPSRPFRPADNILAVIRTLTVTPEHLRTISSNPDLIDKINASSGVHYPVTFKRPYLIENTKLCSSVPNLAVLIIVHTAPNHFELRNAMRRTWANDTHYESLGKVRKLFLLGTVNNQTLQTELEKEFKQNQDLLQGDFVGADSNLTHKGVMGYLWVSERCQNAKYILKVDDDIVVDMYRLFTKVIPNFKNKTKQILCSYITPGTMLITREKKNKWYVNENHFQGQQFYPEYCSGLLVLFTNDVIPAIFKSASVSPFFWVDDVNLYGFVSNHLLRNNINGLEEKDHLLDGQKALKCYRNETMNRQHKCNYLVTGSRKIQVLVDIWSEMTKQYENEKVEKIEEAVTSTITSKTMIRPAGDLAAIGTFTVDTEDLRAISPNPDLIAKINASSDVKYPVTFKGSYLIENPELCSSVPNLAVLIIVHTAPNNFELRNAMRRTWANDTHYESLGKVRKLFLLGTVNNQTVQTELKKEFNEHKDLLQGDFVDAYRNLTHKGVMGYRWVSERCRNPKFILKVDDDIVVNMYRLFTKVIPKIRNKTKQILCHYILPGTMRILREKKSKWYVNENHFKGQKFYPEYCSGFLVLFSNDAIPAMFKAASVTPFFWVDDVYLYGLVPSHVPGFTYTSLEQEAHVLNGDKALKCYRNETMNRLHKCNYLVTGSRTMQVSVDIWSEMTKQYEKVKENEKAVSSTINHETIIRPADKLLAVKGNRTVAPEDLTAISPNPDLIAKINASSDVQYPVTFKGFYLIENPELCSSVPDLTVLIIVHTAPIHFERRNVMRKTWTNDTHYKSLGNVRTLFLLGTVNDKTVQTELENEFKKHQDILQGDFVDAFKNLTHKGVMGYRWVSEWCRNAKYILKVDDNIVVHMFRLFTKVIPKYTNKTKQILCNHILPGTMLIIREKKSQWYVNENHFKGQKFYPEYCSGFLVLFSNDVIPAIFKAASVTPFFWVDNVYLYGLAPSHVPGITYNGLDKKDHMLDGDKALKCYRNKTLNNQHNCNFLVTGSQTVQVSVEIWSEMTKQYKQEKVEHFEVDLPSTIKYKTTKDSE
ncbi:uncharacterized protein LOC128245576 [Mya arenaria]|uniref:uncharacterized protein LOC128245576 n=1 Tax=Mya arenaria TaxID=6604 RepID=UPI0022E95EC0|nr:uncharacterized protein LOC128245576 [Mya arenaria]